MESRKQRTVYQNVVCFVLDLSRPQRRRDPRRSHFSYGPRLDVDTDNPPRRCSTKQGGPFGAKRAEPPLRVNDGLGGRLQVGLPIVLERPFTAQTGSRRLPSWA